MIKKIIAVAFVCAFALCGCAETENADGKIGVVCTGFPQYDWTKELINGNDDKYELILLTENGADIHSFAPSADDIIKIKQSDLIIYNGGESDSWIEEYARETKSVNMLAAVGEDVMLDKEENEPDEHTWLSISNAKKLCEAIAAALAELDPSSAESYEANGTAYEKKLDELDAKYAEMCANAPGNAVVTADRFPFRYLFEDYGIEYFAAFSGCSAETEASFETVKLLSEKAENAPVVMVTDNGNLKLAKTVVSNTSDKEKPIESLNSMQSVTRADIDGGMNYLAVMAENLSVLEKALGE